MCSLVLLLSISLKLVADYWQQVPFIFSCIHFILTHYIGSLYTETMSRKFREISRIRREYVWRFWKKMLFFKSSEMVA